MRNSVSIVVLSLCLGCGGVDSQADAVEAGLDLQEEMIEILEGVTDRESAEEAAKAFQDLIERAEELARQMAELPDPTVEEMKKILEDNEQRMQELQERMMAVVQKIQRYPELQQAFQKAMAGVQARS